MLDRTLLNLHGFAYVDRVWCEKEGRKLSLRVPYTRAREEGFCETIWIDADLQDKQLFAVHSLFDLWLKSGSVLMAEFSARYVLLNHHHRGCCSDGEENIIFLRASIESIPRFFVNGSKIEVASLASAQSLEILDAISLQAS